MTEVTIIRKPPRWFQWRDAVILLLAVSMLLFGGIVAVLVGEVSSVRHELSQRPTAEQFAALTQQLAYKDARIRQLTDTLVKNGVPVPPNPKPAPAPMTSVVPSASPALSPSPSATPAPTARPSPHVSGSGGSPRPHPSPTRTCTGVVLAGTCVTPPPTPAPHA